MEIINNIALYNERMSSSLGDKLFFLELVNDIDTIVDFGCADGTLLKHCPDNWRRIGIDNNPEMLTLAAEKLKGVELYSSVLEMPNPGENALLNMASVTHEIYSYMTLKEIKKLWQDIADKQFKYIVIRDMMVSQETNREWDKFAYKVSENSKGQLFDDFRLKWPERRQRDLLHFLMKYRYIENWSRERDECYFPITLEELLRDVPQNYNIFFKKGYCLEWVHNKIYEDFNYDVKDNTHFQIILSRQ